MSEHKEHNPVEQPTQESEPSVDVTSLKKIDMSVADYDRYAELYPDDPEITELYERYGITPGEPMIVSATDSEQPDRNILLVVATGEDSFTTNRSLTNELEARLRESDRGAERIIPGDDIKELGEYALSAAGIEAPNTTPEDETSERDLMEAKRIFEEQLDRLSSEYAGASNRHKNEIKTLADDLSAKRSQLEDASETAFRYLRSGVDQPDRIRQVVALAIEELTGVNRILGSTLRTVESGHTASSNLGSQAETHKSDAGRVHGEFRTHVGRIVDEAPELDREALEQADAETAEMTIRQTVDADRLKEAALEIGTALRQVEEDVDEAKRRTRNILGRLEDVRGSVGRGRLDSSEYENIVRSAGALARDLQDHMAIRRLAALAKGL